MYGLRFDILQFVYMFSNYTLQDLFIIVLLVKMATASGCKNIPKKTLHIITDLLHITEPLHIITEQTVRAHFKCIFNIQMLYIFEYHDFM